MKTMRFVGLCFLWLIIIFAGRSGAEETATSTLVVCAPGFPGSTTEAQPAMDGLASALATNAGWGAGTLGAMYFENEEDGVARLGMDDAVIALVTLPFFLEHRKELVLEPAVLAVQIKRTANEPWTLVAGNGRIDVPGDLVDWNILSLGGHSSSFVKGVVFDGWGEVPEGLEIAFSNRVLTSLRRAAKGEDVAVLLNGEQADALDRLPFADGLDVIRVTKPMPTSLLCLVGDRLSPGRAGALVDAAVGLADTEASISALAGVQIDRFVGLNQEAIDWVTAAFEKASE